MVCLKSRRIPARYYGANPSEVAINTVQVTQGDGIQRSEPEPFLDGVRRPLLSQSGRCEAPGMGSALLAGARMRANAF